MSLMPVNLPTWPAVLESVDIETRSRISVPSLTRAADATGRSDWNGGSMSRIWLYGKSNNQVYLYDTESGAHRGFPNRTYRGATAGDFSRMTGKDVATYVDEKGQIIWLQV